MPDLCTAQRDGVEFDRISDAVDDGSYCAPSYIPVLIVMAVNAIKGRLKWDEQSQFDASKDKTKFRQFETACDRVKCALPVHHVDLAHTSRRNFYKEQHGTPPSLPACTSCSSANRKADRRVQHQ